MNDKFLLAREVKNFIIKLDDILINFPRKDLVMKKKIYEDSIFLLKLVYNANNTDDAGLKTKYKQECITLVNMLDFYIEYCYKKKYISLKICNNLTNNIIKINKMIYGWIKND